MRRRGLKRNLAVSTVVANMLMISITLSLAAILVAWAGTTYGTFSGSSQLFFVQRGQALQERFVIEAVYFNYTDTPNQVLIFVRNVGVLQVDLVAIYVNGNSVNLASWVLSPCAANSDGSVTLVVGASNQGNVCEFRVDTSWVSGSVVSIVAASARGNQATYTVRGP